ncbi:unnamed protein product [Dicrocoelium dendriticum]|nr:unnamed protein product [Dicrocoelium dendriticum]
MDWSIPQHLGVDEAWTLLYSKFTSLITQVVPLCKGKRFSNGPPWIDRELKSLMRRRRKLWDKFKTTQLPLDYLDYKAVRNICTFKKREKRQQYERRLAEESSAAPKLLFSYLRRRTKAVNGIPALYSKENDTTLHDDDAKAGLLALQYSSVFSTEPPFTCDLASTPSRTLERLEISPELVVKLLFELNPNSSPGPDGLHPLFLRTLAEYIAVPVCQIFQRSLDAGRLPLAWKMGTVKPIYRGGNRQDPGNYRPICLTSIVCKVMERILKRDLQSHLDGLNVISSAQHGFRRARSCISNLLVARERRARSLDAGNRLDVFVDFKKAFDTVPHERLLFKLRSIGVSGEILSWITDFLDGRSMRVKVNEVYSASVPMTSRVPQGSVLGPELFKVYINDLPSILQTDCLFYADDLKIWMEVPTPEADDRLQEKLDLFHSWSSEWRLPINREKCSVLPIGSSDPFGAYHIGSFLIRNAACEKDLGILVSPDLRTTEDTLRKIAAANRMFCAIRRSFSRMTPEVFRLLFSPHVRPILEYGLPAAYPFTKTERVMIERVQRRGSKSISALRDLPYTQRLRQMNMFPLDYRRRRGDLIYTRRILRGQMGSELQEFFQLCADSSTWGHSWKLFKPRRVRIHSDFTLSTRVVKDWNSLPELVVSAQREESFKKLLDSYLLSMQGSCCFRCDRNGPLRNTASQHVAQSLL